MADAAFFDFRTAPAPGGGFQGDYDLSGLAPGIEKVITIIIGISEGDTATVRIRRGDYGQLTAYAQPGMYEPVLEGERFVGLRFPGCDRYPWRVDA